MPKTAQHLLATLAGRPDLPASDLATGLRDSAAALAAAEWGVGRIRRGEPLRVVASGLSRSGSTWQYIMLVLLVEAAVEMHSPLPRAERTVHSAFGHDADAFTNCLAQRYCVCKSHEHLPDVLLRVHAVFTAHRTHTRGDSKAEPVRTSPPPTSCLRPPPGR